MQKTLALLLAFGGCQSVDSTGNVLPNGSTGGGSGVGGGSRLDASVRDSGSDVVILRGQLCDVRDFRFPYDCLSLPEDSQVTFSGVNLQIGSLQTTSLADGTFKFTLESDEVDAGTLTDGTDKPSVRVSDPQNRFISSVIEIERLQGAVQVPAVRDEVWQTLLTDLGSVAPESTATLAMTFSNGTSRVAGIEVIVPAGSFTNPYYDRGAADSWSTGGATDVDGSALLFSVPVEASERTTITIARDGQSGDIPEILVLQNFVTFATVQVSASTN